MMWIYLALILADFSEKTRFVSLMLWSIFVVCCVVFIFLVIASSEVENNQYYISAKNFISKIAKLVAVLAIVFSVLYVLLPYKNTYYIIAGLGVGNYAIEANSERVSKALKILDLKLDNEIENLMKSARGSKQGKNNE